MNIRPCLLMRKELKHRITRRARLSVLQHYPHTARLGENDRQWWILKEGFSPSVNMDTYYCQHRVTKVRALLAKEDCIRIDKH
jgi:hypothetical protein